MDNVNYFCPQKKNYVTKIVPKLNNRWEVHTSPIDFKAIGGVKWHAINNRNHIPNTRNVEFEMAIVGRASFRARAYFMTSIPNSAGGMEEFCAPYREVSVRDGGELLSPISNIHHLDASAVEAFVRDLPRQYKNVMDFLAGIASDVALIEEKFNETCNKNEALISSLMMEVNGCGDVNDEASEEIAILTVELSKIKKRLVELGNGEY